MQNAIALAIMAAFAFVAWRLRAMSATIDRLTASVANLVTVDDSLIELVKNLSQTIRNNSGDPVALVALADRLDAEAQAVADAVTANTVDAQSTPAAADAKPASDDASAKGAKG